MPNISHLQAFLEAASCGSFTEASLNLNLSESAVSARLKALESALGERLFTRSKHGVILNNYGNSFLPFAETIVGAWQQGKDVVAAAAKGNVQINIGIQQDLWEIFAAEWYALIKLEHENIQLSITCDYTDVLCQRVAQNLLDIAVIFKPKHVRGVILEKLAQLPLALVSNQNIKWSGYLPNNYCYVDWGGDFAAWHNKQFDSPQTSGLSVSVSGMALSTVLKNGGTAYLLENSVNQYSESKQVYILDQAPKFNMDVWVVHSSSRARTKIIKNFAGIDLLRNLMN